jgi:long-subunit acyl-CoA synthetase (AMP-forming)
MALVGCWRRGMTACPIDPQDELATNADAALAAFDARLHIARVDHPHAVAPEHAGAPAACGSSLREASDPTPTLALIMSTSGSGGPPKRVCLSWSNVRAQLASHTPALGLAPETGALSVLPWRHAFGLLVDVLPALLSGATVAVEPSGGRDPESIMDAARRHGARWISMVPRQVRRLLETPGGEAFLRGLDGGVVGGAPVRADLAEALSGTRLRAGYGLTEASPGVCLGDRGQWREGWLGAPLACETLIDASGELLVRGANVCAGSWSDGAFRPAREGRWLRTGDVVESASSGLVHLGRIDHRFKLENGRLIDAPAIERRLRSALPTGVEAIVTTSDHRRLTLTVSPGFAAAARAAWPGDLPAPSVEERPIELSSKGEPVRRRIMENAA